MNNIAILDVIEKITIIFSDKISVDFVNNFSDVSIALIIF